MSMPSTEVVMQYTNVVVADPSGDDDRKKKAGAVLWTTFVK